MSLASVALATARTFLNDDNASVWTDAILMPKLQEAHRELQVDLWKVGSPILREVTTPLTVVAGVVTLGANQPPDLVTPTRLMEASSPSTTSWEPMTEVTYIPIDVAQTTKLVYWAWREETIVFLGSSATRYVIVYYRKLITIPTLATSPIGVIFGEMYLGPRVAAMAAGSVGNEKAYDIMTAMAKENFTKVVDANRGQQQPTGKP